jgi:dihydroflavonol-4-reductase
LIPQKKVVFLTGANGLVGTFLAEKLLQAGYMVKALRRPDSDITAMPLQVAEQIIWQDGSLDDLPWLENTLHQVDYVVHAAAKVSFNPADKAELYKSNVTATANLVNTCLAIQNKPWSSHKFIKFLHVSSVAALGRSRISNMVDEETKWEPSENHSWYGKTKYLAELEVWRAANEGLPVVIINPSVVLGPGNIDKSSTTLFRYVLHSGHFYTDGLINYLDVRDLSEIAIKLMESGIENERFILNAGKTPYVDFFAEIAEHFSTRAPHFRAGKMLAQLAWRFEWVKSLFTDKAPVITRETAISSRSQYQFRNDKVVATLGVTFRTLEDTIKWVCTELKARTHETN